MYSTQKLRKWILFQYNNVPTTLIIKLIEQWLPPGLADCNDQRWSLLLCAIPADRLSRLHSAAREFPGASAAARVSGAQCAPTLRVQTPSAPEQLHRPPVLQIRMARPPGLVCMWTVETL